MGPRFVLVNGSPATASVLLAAVADALDGRGPAVLPATTDPGPVGDPGGAALVIATSGSTGHPRRVLLSAAALRASAGATAARLGGPGRWLLALPAEHVAGAQVVVRSVLSGSAPVVQDLRAGFRPGAFAAAAGRLGPGRRYTSLVPTQLARLLDDPDRAVGKALLGFDAVLVGGAALPVALRERARAAGVPVVATYGMSETAGGCVYDGVPLDGVTVALDDGRIVLGGPTVADGYLGLPAETAAVFRGGTFRTGDLGRIEDGRLQVLGRIDDVIVTGGENVAPAAVERVLQAQPGVRAACVVGVADPEWGQAVAAALVVDAGADTAAILTAVRTELGRHAVPRRTLTVDKIPERGIGKPDRTAVAQLFCTLG